MSEITAKDVARHGLSSEEYATILRFLGRTPSLTELGVFSVMWSEHCSYKSSKRWLQLFPTEAPWVLCGPGENAGVIDIGDNHAIVFKMESHNHPSFIEPYQGAATGVGGILRDVFTMGARPIANLNALRFGAPDHPRTRYLVSGVVAGIGGYGNCVGVPTVAGECGFHPGYNGNILVNAMTVGLADARRLFFSKAAGVGNPLVYVGSKTGRDGIHGATMASAEFSGENEEKRPTVQVGDPFTEKLLIEACLELMATEAIVAIQDMGAAGLTSSSFEMASKGEVGVELDLDLVPTREVGMSAYEIMLSESQERMLMVLKPGHEAEARAIFEKWDLDFAVVGRITDTRHMTVRHGGEIVADVPIHAVVDGAPEYDRPRAQLPHLTPLVHSDIDSVVEPLQALLGLIGSPDLASRRWIWEQYDHMVMANSVQRPGGDAAVVRIENTTKGLAVTCDCTPRYCGADPFEGGKQAVAEAWRNLVSTGARPLAITNCLNFGNPEKPEIMAQLVACIEGMAAACHAFDMPVVSGNVSLYNETEGEPIPPTPTVGAVGLIADLTRMAKTAITREGDVILLIGGNLDAGGWLGQSLYLREILGREDGAPPPVDLIQERRNGEFVRTIIEAGHISACHDISDGGLLVALAEMAMNGGVGASLDIAPIGNDGSCSAGWLFGEDQGRFIVCAPPEATAEVFRLARVAGVTALRIGETGGSELTLGRTHAISLMRLIQQHERWLPDFMGRT